MILFLCSLFLVFVAVSQSTNAVWMHPNKGQWEQNVLHKVKLLDGDMFITRSGMTFSLHNMGELMHHHDEGAALHHDEFKGQVIHYNFEGADFQGLPFDSNLSDFYENYFQGNNPSRWKSNIHAVQRSKVPNFLPGVDLVYESGDAEFKYSLVLKPDVNPSSIKTNITGANNVEILKNGNLSIEHQFGFIHESKPIAWQIINDKKEKVEIEFSLTGNQLGYTVGVYDPSYPLVIDPSLTFSTFSGSTADNWGSTATPDAAGNVFGGGIVFAQGFPTITGTYDSTFNGVSLGSQNFDIGISKFSGNGATLMFSTYLGGAASNEFPSSMICAPNGELYVLGMTGSFDFPVFSGYDMTFDGGTGFFPQGGSASIPGSDIFITRFNPAGTALLSSTFVGGSGNDGYNGATALNYNYGDSYRGEITLDAAQNVYVASSTTSTNFPVVGSTTSTMQGIQSAVAFKMNSNLTNMLWSRYIGGNTADAGYSIQVADNGAVYTCGGTSSSNLSLVAGNDLTFNGGSADGYLMRLDPANGATMNGTYIGMNEYDQAYIVQTDIQNEPYVLGQTESNFPISTGKYGVANSGQFIRKYTANLATVYWTTVIGGGSGHVELSPTAFLVSDCYDIYLAGWGGPLNASNGQASFSTVTGFPVTSDAYQATTLGDNFYLAVLGGNAASLKYATFFGGITNSNKHVDGGTSRFDKQGRVYHAVCASCGGLTNGFTTTPGAYSTTNNSTNCNMAVFKFDLSIIIPLINVLDPLICYPEPVIFNNQTLNADQFFWDFGDGTSSTVQSPSHVFPGAGTYTVTLIAGDVAGCYQADTSVYVIDIGDFQGGIVQPTDTICIGGSYQMQASGGGTYAWSPAASLDDPTSATPIATVDSTTTFTVVISDSCGADTLSATLYVHTTTPSVSNDTSLCIGNSVPLFASGGSTYLWSPATYLTNPNSANPVCTPDSAITYTVTITTSQGCVYQEQVFVDVFFDPPMSFIEDTLRICSFTSESTTVSGAQSYSWEPSLYVSPIVGATVTLSPPNDQYFVCNFTNACGTIKDSVFADVIFPNVNGFGDTTICPRDIATLSATGGSNYVWFPSVSTINSSASLVSVSPEVNTNYQVVGEDEFGCYDTSYVYVQLYPQPTVKTDVKIFAIFGDEVDITAQGTPSGGSYQWSPAEFLSCPTCATTEATPNSDFTYEVIYTDLNTCQTKGGVQILYQPTLYIPNTFTPDEDEFNGVFKVVAVNVKSFQLDLYNRWGQIVHVMTESTNYWDGYYKDRKVPDGVYTWKMTYYDQYEKPKVLTGHVTLLR